MERDAILIPYLREGLQAGDKCVWIVDAADPWADLGVTRHSCYRGAGGIRVRAQRVPAPVFEGDPVPLRPRTVTTHPKVPLSGIVLDNPDDLEPDVLLVTRK